MSRLRTILRRLRTLLWTALTLLTLLAAILVGVGKLLMPYSDRYQPRLEQWLSQEFQQPVRVAGFTGEWKAFGPRISLEGVTLLGEGLEEIAIQRAALDIKPLNWLLPGRPLYSFRIIGADLALERASDGTYELSGLGVSGRGEPGSGASGLSRLARVGEVSLDESSVSFTDQAQGIDLQLSAVRGRLQLDGRELLMDLEASISDKSRTPVLGDLEATLLIEFDDERRLSDMQWHVKTRELMIAGLVGQLPGHPLIPQSGWLNAELWGAWSPATKQIMEGVVDLRDSTLAAQPRLLQLDHLNARFRWNFQARKVWRIDLSDLVVKTADQEWSSANLSVERNIPGNLGIWLSSDFIEMEFPLQLTQRVMSVYDTQWPRNLPRQARGALHEFDLVLDGRWKLLMARGRFERTDAWDWDRWPDVAGIRGNIDLLAGEGELRFEGDGVRLDWPRNFRRQALVDIADCTLEILWGDTWQMDARDCMIRNEDLELHGRARFAKSEGRPEADVNLFVSRANLGELDDFWPRSVMRPTVVNWLRRGLVAGRVERGRFSLRGDMDDWPFRDNNGRLEALLDVSEVDLDYYPGWPRAVRLDGKARFVGSSMQVDGAVGTLGGIPVQSVSGRVGDFRSPLLELRFESAAPLPDMIKFIERTPLLDNVDLDLAQFEFSGPANAGGVLAAPLRAGGDPVWIDGRLDLPGNGFTERVSGVQLQNITGSIAYDRETMRGTGLNASFNDTEVALDLVADWDGPEVFRADLQGRLAVHDVIPASLLDSEPLLGFLDGQADWKIGLTVNSEAEPEQREIWLDMFSELEGVALQYPVPLSKTADEAWPLRVRYPVRSSNPVFSVTAEDRATLSFDIADGMNEPRRVGFVLGDGPGELPEPGYFSLQGDVGILDLDKWMELLIERFRQDRGTGGLQFEAAELRADELHFFNRAFPDVVMSVQFEDGLLQGTFDSELLAGEIRYNQSDDGSHTLVADMERLHLPEPLSGGMIMETDPATLPEMHLTAEEFSYLGLDFGATRIEAYPQANGFHIASVEATAPALHFQARGDWIRDALGERSDFDIVLTSESLGSLMSAMKISTVLQGGQTMLRYDAWWPGPPAAFALSRLNGELDFSVVDGNIRNADAGAGRMVGLLSIAALPRRLALDFRDVFGSGFSFDQAHGTVVLEDGNAFTDDLTLESTAATMAIRGSSDLVNKAFDYELSVRPGVGQTLPVLGAIAGGPGGAAAGLALQGLLQKSLGDATEARYAITGTWQEPVVERIPVATSAAGESGAGDE